MGMQQAGAVCIDGVDCDPPPGAGCDAARSKLNMLRVSGATAQAITEGKFLVFVQCDL
jgi:hypothetical protein